VRNAHTESHQTGSEPGEQCFSPGVEKCSQHAITVAQGYRDTGQAMREPVRCSTSNPEVRGEKMTGSFDHISAMFKEWS